MNKGLTYDDIALIPQYNNVPSRLEPNFSSWLTKNVQIGLPILPANMDCVIGPELARVLHKNNGIPIFHRFTGNDTMLKWLKLFPRSFVSSGVGEKDLDFIEHLLRKGVPFLGVCLDIAHGHSKMMKDSIIHVKDMAEGFGRPIDIIAGNVCTPQAYQDLVSWGADAVKVGIGGGAACTTRGVTGFGVPQFTAVHECAKIANKLRIPIIADGSIRSSNDIVKALAAGASTVMAGKIFAATSESSAQKQNIAFRPNAEPVWQARYRGQASEEFQIEQFGKVKEGTVPEGEGMWVPVTGSAQTLIDRLLGGLRTGFTYGGARSIKELQRKAEFIEVTNMYAVESGVRK